MPRDFDRISATGASMGFGRIAEPWPEATTSACQNLFAVFDTDPKTPLKRSKKLRDRIGSLVERFSAELVSCAGLPPKTLTVAWNQAVQLRRTDRHGYLAGAVVAMELPFRRVRSPGGAPAGDRPPGAGRSLRSRGLAHVARSPRARSGEQLVTKYRRSDHVLT